MSSSEGSADALTNATREQTQELRALRRAVDELVAPARDRNRRAEERDPIGSGEPKRLSHALMVRSTPILHIEMIREGFLSKIPAAFWSLDADVFVVACPCAESPRVPVDQSVECSCGRIYLAVGGKDGELADVGGSVWVANSPKWRPKPRWERIVDEWRARSG